MKTVTDQKITKGSNRAVTHDGAVLPTAHMPVPMPCVQPTRSPQSQPPAPNSRPTGTPPLNQTPAASARSSRR